MIIYLLHGFFLVSAIILFIFTWKWGKLSWSQQPAEEMVAQREESE